MEYPSNCQIFGNQYYEKTKQRKQPLKLQHHQTESAKNYPALRLDAKTAKTNADKVQLFAESVERHFGIQSNNFDSNHFDEVNQFIENNYE